MYIQKMDVFLGNTDLCKGIFEYAQSISFIEFRGGKTRSVMQRIGRGEDVI